MHHPTRRVLPVVVAAALVGGLGACSGDEPPTTVTPEVSASASPSPSPTLDAAAKREQEAVDAAKATLTDYYAAINRTAQDGYEDWAAELVPFWGTVEISNEESLNYEQKVQDNARQEGSIDVVSMDEVDYTPDADGKGADEVVIDACGDISGVTSYVGDKVSPRAEGVPDRFVTKFVLQYHPDAEVWGIHKSETGMEPRSC